MLKAYKLFRVRKDGSLGSLFINAKARLQVGEWIEAKPHRTDGFAYRPGWHACRKPKAPHLSERGRRWYRVELKGITLHQKPKAQGGLWYTAKQLKIIAPVRKRVDSKRRI